MEYNGILGPLKGFFFSYKVGNMWVWFPPHSSFVGRFHCIMDQLDSLNRLRFWLGLRNKKILLVLAQNHHIIINIWTHDITAIKCLCTSQTWQRMCITTTSGTPNFINFIKWHIYHFIDKLIYVLFCFFCFFVSSLNGPNMSFKWRAEEFNALLLLRWCQ